MARRTTQCHHQGREYDHVVDRRTDEIDLDTRRISLVGKVRKPRVVPVPHVLETMLRENLDEMRPKLPVSSYLFANPRGNGNLRGRYGPRALHNLVVEAGTSAGVARRHQPPLLASYLCNLPRSPARGHPRRPAPDGPLQHRDDLEVPAPLKRRPPRRRRLGRSQRAEGAQTAD